MGIECDHRSNWDQSRDRTQIPRTARCCCVVGDWQSMPDRPQPVGAGCRNGVIIERSLSSTPGLCGVGGARSRQLPSFPTAVSDGPTEGLR